MFLRKVRLLRHKVPSFEEFPFSIPVIGALEELDFNTGVTFFVGENGSGKSTLLEAIASNCGFHLSGGAKNNQYSTYEQKPILDEYIRLSWMPKISNGFFLRAESFYNFATYLDILQKEHPDQDVFKAYGGKSLHEQSHGESFLSLFSHRFNEKALYLLDEPEAALSPARQLALLKIIHDLSKKGNAQFIIATHSPILLGYPEGVILNFDSSSLEEIRYEMTDHYQITHYFLQNRDRMLHHLLTEEDETK
ncbi:AAA family ATPase [Priestia filamentosa]|uniref:AAA family ATPase n=1 Tax=Priestia filamentosa TaxID=1402861 RepID=A0A0H4KL18_9BACI|nr:AAA family ATPase [Priestia filamentosa]AKO93561.1 AAA family ATPase [Priestia filamentosa]RJS67385.1 AAA family ATPase [Priestia filamentosa]WCM14413.1 AAA family ATPase [Priestia filamentosa]